MSLTLSMVEMESPKWRASDDPIQILVYSPNNCYTSTLVMEKPKGKVPY